MDSLLSVKGLTKSFGGLMAVKDLAFDVPMHSIFGLVGPNGSGKTTTFNLLAGVYKPDRGEICFKGENIAGLRSWQVCRKGIGRIFQIPRTFQNMTVLESVMLGLLFGKTREMDLNSARSRAVDIINFLALGPRRDVLCDRLTLVDQRRTEIARALATSPELLLLDEPIAGLNPTETEDLLRFVRQIKDAGVTIILIEHVMAAVMAVSDNVLVMDYGERIACGKPSEIIADQNVIKAYLGSRRIKYASSR